jgi:hypothetical protein
VLYGRDRYLCLAWMTRLDQSPGAGSVLREIDWPDRGLLGMAVQG